MSELIWNYSFPMRHGKYNNDYEFYSDGSIKHIYDQHDWKIDVEEFVKPSSISLKESQTMLEECPEDIRERIKAILELKLNNSKAYLSPLESILSYGRAEAAGY